MGCKETFINIIRQIDTSNAPWWIGLLILGVLFATFCPIFCCCYLYHVNDETKDTRQVADISFIETPPFQPHFGVVSPSPVPPDVLDLPPRYEDLFRTPSPLFLEKVTVTTT